VLGIPILAYNFMLLSFLLRVHDGSIVDGDGKGF
jgi:hypothetical protein